MKIGLISGSPKPTGSTSSLLLMALKPFLEEGNEFSEIGFHRPEVTKSQLAKIKSCDVLVISFPLYVDGIPSQLLYCLTVLERELVGLSLPITVYAIVNCGFFEGEQNSLAIEMISNFCRRAGLAFGQGLGIGGGGMMAGIQSVPIGKGPKKNLLPAMTALADSILHKTSGRPLFISPNFPRFAYILGAHFGWTMMIRKNGLKCKDLHRRL